METVIQLLTDTHEIVGDLPENIYFCCTKEKVQESDERFQVSFYRHRKNTKVYKDQIWLKALLYGT